MVLGSAALGFHALSHVKGLGIPSPTPFTTPVQPFRYANLSMLLHMGIVATLVPKMSSAVIPAVTAPVKVLLNSTRPDQWSKTGLQ